MAIPALQFEVKKDKWEQLQNGTYKLTVTINPMDLTDNNERLLLDFVRSPPGTRFVLAAAQITDTEETREEVVPDAARAVNHDKTPAPPVGADHTCLDCDGTGKLSAGLGVSARCPACHGTGKQAPVKAGAEQCQTCGGRGEFLYDKSKNTFGLNLSTSMWVHCPDCKALPVVDAILAESRKPAKPKTPFHDLPRSQQAGMLCGDSGFQEWCGAIEIMMQPDIPFDCTIAEAAAIWVRQYCRIKSRGELGDDESGKPKNPEAAIRWDKLRDQYEQASGRVAVRHD
jgi:hypothetical protein